VPGQRVPGLDADRKVTGVVSEADLLVKEAMLSEPGGIGGLLTGLVHHAARAKAAGVTAADLMTSPAVTIGPDDTVEHAARLMYDRKVKRLPVIDEHGRLVGIISRTDVLAVSVIVRSGVVRLEGNSETTAIGHGLVSRTRHVQGAVAVRDRLDYPVATVPSSPGPYF
jgi:CBS-domain-containing membrane protein